MTYHVGIDMDGVICDLVTPLAERFGYKYEDVTRYDFSSLPPDVAKATFDAIFEPGFFRSLKPYPGAIDFVKKLLGNTEVTPWFISMPAPKVPISYADKMEWIMEHIPEMAPTTILCQTKSRIDVDAIVDDYQKNLLASPAKLKILFAQPWNEFCKDDWPLRTDNYDMVYAAISNEASWREWSRGL